MKLLAGKAYDPGTEVSKSFAGGTVLTAFDTTNARLTFTAPDSGKVFVRIGCNMAAGSSQPSRSLLGVLEGGTVRFRSAIVGGRPASDTGATSFHVEVAGLITGLTPGNAHTYDAAYGGIGASGCSFLYGGPNSSSVPSSGALVFEIWEVVDA